MAVTYPTAVKNARLDAVTSQIGTTGVLEIGTAGMASVLATIALGNPAAAAASGGVLTFSGFPRSDTAADASGTAAAGTTVAPSYPTGITAGDVLVMFVGQKPATANAGTVTTPTGWTLQDSLTAAGGYGTTLGADTGNTNLFVYTKDTVTGAETGADTLAATGKVIVTGQGAATEANDTLAAAGQIIVKGSLAAVETGIDTLQSQGGKPPIVGTCAATEAGQDTVGGYIAPGYIEPGYFETGVVGTVSNGFTITGQQALLLHKLHQLHGLASPLQDGPNTRKAGDLEQAISEANGTVTITTTGGNNTLAGIVGKMIEELAALHGLTAPLEVTATQRKAGAIMQTITEAAGTTTVTRQ